MNGDIPFPEAPLPPAPNPKAALFQLAAFALSELLQHAPEMFAELSALFSKPSVSVEDIDQLRNQIALTRYADVVKSTAIAKEDQT